MLVRLTRAAAERATDGTPASSQAAIEGSSAQEGETAPRRILIGSQRDRRRSARHQRDWTPVEGEGGNQEGEKGPEGGQGRVAAGTEVAAVIASDTRRRRSLVGSRKPPSAVSRKTQPAGSSQRPASPIAVRRRANRRRGGRSRSVRSDRCESDTGNRTSRSCASRRHTACCGRDQAADWGCPAQFPGRMPCGAGPRRWPGPIWAISIRLNMPRRAVAARRAAVSPAGRASACRGGRAARDSWPPSGAYGKYGGRVEPRHGRTLAGRSDDRRRPRGPRGWAGAGVASTRPRRRLAARRGLHRVRRPGAGLPSRPFIRDAAPAGRHDRGHRAAIQRRGWPVRVEPARRGRRCGRLGFGA